MSELENKSLDEMSTDEISADEKSVDNVSDEKNEKPLIDESIFGVDMLAPKNQTSNIPSDSFVSNARNDMAARKVDAPKKTSDKPMIIALVLLFVLLIGLCIYIAVSLSKGFSNLHAKKDMTYESDSGDPWAEILGDDDKNADSDLDRDSSLGENDDPLGSGTDAPVFGDDSWKDAYVNHDPSEFSGPYYEEFVDCIDENVSYTIEREFEDVEDEKHNTCIRISYVQIEGDIPNLKEINRTLKEKALEEYEAYLTYEDEYNAMTEQQEIGLYITVQSFVTYNDAETISVAIQKDSRIGMSGDVGMESVNVNLVTGTIMDNTQILKIQDSFGEEFRQRSNKQNGSTQGVEIFSNVDIVRMLNDEDSLIVFYTPIGIELGYQYQESGYCGWVTISMEDYQSYLNGM